MIPSISYSAGWLAGNITEVAVKYGNGCVELNNYEVIKIDLNSAAGKAEFSMALAAKATGKKIEVYQTDDALLEGCNTGATIKPHSMLRIVE